MLTQLVYASSAVRPFDAATLDDILRTSRRNNAAADVTGALVYHDGNVMQVLEGPDAAVKAVYQRVAADPRHRGLVMLLRSTVERRTFPDWAMGLRRPEEMGGDGAARSLFDMTAPGPERAHRLLASFRTLVGV